MIIKKSHSNIKSTIRLCNDNERLSALIVGLDDIDKEYIFNLIETIHEKVLRCYESKNEFMILFKNGSLIDTCRTAGNSKGRKYNIILVGSDIDDELLNYVLIPQIVRYLPR